MSVNNYESHGNSSQGCFGLTEKQIQNRTGKYLAGLEFAKGRFVGALVTPDSPMFDAMCSVERQVFEQAFADNDEGYMEEKYGPLRETSRFLAVIERNDDARSQPIAFMRIASPDCDDPSTLSLDDAEAMLKKTPREIAETHNIEDLGKCWDVATMGVVQEYHGSVTSYEALIMLNRMFLRLAAGEGIEHMVTILDQKALKGLLSLGAPFVPMGDPSGTFDDAHAFSFDGSERSFAVYARVSEFEDAAQSTYYDKMHAARSERSREMIQNSLGRIILHSPLDWQINLPAAASTVAFSVAT